MIEKKRNKEMVLKNIINGKMTFICRMIKVK